MCLALSVRDWTQHFAKAIADTCFLWLWLGRESISPPGYQKYPWAPTGLHLKTALAWCPILARSELIATEKDLEEQGRPMLCSDQRYADCVRIYPNVVFEIVYQTPATKLELFHIRPTNNTRDDHDHNALIGALIFGKTGQHPIVMLVILNYLVQFYKWLPLPHCVARDLRRSNCKSSSMQSCRCEVMGFGWGATLR